ncbi:MAG: quinone-dependent dihydroorotate dehydrogenase [Polyangiaceae bacterium]
MSYALLRPVFFAFPPSWAHSLAMTALAPLEFSDAMRRMFGVDSASFDPRLRVNKLGLEFPHPVGLAAGFDKNARRVHALAALGFSHLEIGTVTALPQIQNPTPNLFRLRDDLALVNRLGFPNDGANEVLARLQTKNVNVPIGISIGKSRAVAINPIEPAIQDYVTSFKLAKQTLKKIRGFVVVNVSSPNTKDLRAMQGAEIAKRLLNEIARENKREDETGSRVPILLKVAPDLDDPSLEALLEVVDMSSIDGVVATNTTIARENLATDPARIAKIGAGGLSGPPVHARALEVVKRSRARLGAEKTIIGAGGVCDAAGVLRMLRAGADLVQIYTGFIYGGPFIAARIAREIGREIDRSGAASLLDLARG